MGIFKKRNLYALSDILKGLHSAINSTQEMLQAQQIQNLSKFWKAEDGSPVSLNLKVGSQLLNVPLMPLVSHSHLEMEDVEIKFKARVGDVADHSLTNKMDNNQVLTHSELLMQMEGIKASDDDVMEISIRFKQKDTPEGVARLANEYNKHI